MSVFVVVAAPQRDKVEELARRLLGINYGQAAAFVDSLPRKICVADAHADAVRKEFEDAGAVLGRSA